MDLSPLAPNPGGIRIQKSPNPSLSPHPFQPSPTGEDHMFSLLEERGRERWETSEVSPFRRDLERWGFRGQRIVLRLVLANAILRDEGSGI